MRILQLTSARYVGGGERHVADLSRALADRGHEVFAGLSPHAAIRDALSFLPDERISEFRFRGPMDVGTARAIVKLVAAENIDLIHAHVARDYTIAALASRLAGLPFIITRHVLFPMSKLHRLLLRGARFVIAPSDAVAESLRAQGIFPSEKIVTIRHGLDPRGVVSRRDRADEDFVVGSVGNLDPVKGFDVLIRAAAIVVTKRQDVRFEIAGSDRERDQRNERELTKLISRLGLVERVSLTGWAADVRETIAGFDLFVSASRSESFGYAIAEAMLAGVPVIATETEGAKEIIRNAEVGTLVAIDAPASLAAAIIEIAHDRLKRQSMSSAGQKHIEDVFPLEKMIDETESLYRKVISTRS